MIRTIESSNGEIKIDESGKVIYQNTTPECGKLDRFDLDEYKKVCGNEAPEVVDILDIRGVFEDGSELVWTDYKKARRIYEISM